VYDVNVNHEDIISLSSVCGYDLEYYIVSINGATDIPNQNGAVYLSIVDDGNNNSHLLLIFYGDEHSLGENEVLWPTYTRQLFYIDELQYFGHNTILKLAITAEFPEEDTGYIEEGFDYCIDVGANLVASPCRDEMDIIDTLPSEIADNLTGIIGQGVAATNQDGNWAGSLSGLGGGNGYWMLSNVNACFNYNCAEN
jgi:hypothetical protein